MNWWRDRVRTEGMDRDLMYPLIHVLCWQLWMNGIMMEELDWDLVNPLTSVSHTDNHEGMGSGQRGWTGTWWINWPVCPVLTTRMLLCQGASHAAGGQTVQPGTVRCLANTDDYDRTLEELHQTTWGPLHGMTLFHSFFSFVEVHLKQNPRLKLLQHTNMGFKLPFKKKANKQSLPIPFPIILIISEITNDRQKMQDVPASHPSSNTNVIPEHWYIHKVNAIFPFLLFIALFLSFDCIAFILIIKECSQLSLWCHTGACKWSVVIRWHWT